MGFAGLRSSLCCRNYGPAETLSQADAAWAITVVAVLEMIKGSPLRLGEEPDPFIAVKSDWRGIWVPRATDHNFLPGSRNFDTCPTLTCRDTAPHQLAS
jgi:hypothetical protein